MDLKLDEQTNKLAFSKGRLFLTQNRQDTLRQRLSIRLLTQRGTWFLNINYGIDWFNSVLVKGVSKLYVDSLIQAEILKEQMVDRILSFESSVDRTTRVYTCRFKVKLISNEVSDTITLLANENGYVVVNNDNFAIKTK